MVFKWMLLLAILSLFTGCKTKTVLVPVEKVKIEYRDRLRVDSVYNSDTTYIRKSNDTVLIDVIRWRTKYILKTDSVIRVDSIPYPVEVVREVNKLTKWQRWRLNALNIIVLVIVAYVVIKIRLL
jgi:hypothetical protein